MFLNIQNVAKKDEDIIVRKENKTYNNAFINTSNHFYRSREGERFIVYCAGFSPLL